MQSIAKKQFSSHHVCIAKGDNIYLMTDKKKGYKKFDFTSEAINSYGFRVLTSGIDWSQFAKNPVMLFNHNRWGSDYNGPVGNWQELDLNATAPAGYANFDLDDDKAVKIAGKVDGGFIKGASLGLRIIETSTDPALMLPGQVYPTVTKCKVVEVSVVDIPSDDNALALYDANDNRIELNETTLVKLFNAPPSQPSQQQKSNTMDFKQLLLTTLNLPANTTDADIAAGVQAMVNKITTLSAENKKLIDEKEASHANLIKETVELAIAGGKITETQKPVYEALLKADFKNGKAALDAIIPTKEPDKKPASQVNLNQIIQNNGNGGQGGAKSENKTLSDWIKNDFAGLQAMKKNKPDEYKTLCLASGLQEDDIDWN